MKDALQCPSLFKAFESRFRIGAAVSSFMTFDPAYRALIRRHYNSLTALDLTKTNVLRVLKCYKNDIQLLDLRKHKAAYVDQSYDGGKTIFIRDKNDLGWYRSFGKSVVKKAGGWRKISKKQYYFGTNGQMATGWTKVSGKWYYMDETGVMQTGWQKISGKWYYFLSNGSMVTGTRKIGTKTYRFDKSGVCLNP